VAKVNILKVEIQCRTHRGTHKSQENCSWLPKDLEPKNSIVP